MAIGIRPDSPADYTPAVHPRGKQYPPFTAATKRELMNLPSPSRSELTTKAKNEVAFVVTASSITKLVCKQIGRF